MLVDILLKYGLHVWNIMEEKKSVNLYFFENLLSIGLNMTIFQKSQMQPQLSRVTSTI